MKTVALGFVGTVLDRHAGPTRWDHWRPSVALTQQPDFVVHRFELILAKSQRALGERLRDDIETVSPETEVRLHWIVWLDPWNLAEVFVILHYFSKLYPF